MMSAIQTGFQGMERASGVVNSAASNVARTAPPATSEASPPGEGSKGDISRDMANLIVGHRTYDANAKVVEVAARMLDTII